MITRSELKMNKENMIMVSEIAYQALRDPHIRETILDRLDISEGVGEEILGALRKALDDEEDTAESQPSEATEIITAFADRGPLTDPRWSGEAVWLTEDDDGHDVEVHTPEFGVCRTEVTITADELGGTLPDAPADVVSWLRAHIEALPIEIELTDHEQDYIYGEIPRGYFAANPDEDFASDHLRVFASPNGRHTMIDMAQEGGTFFVLVEIGLDVIVEPMSAAAPLVWPPAFTQTAEEDTAESQPSEATEEGT